MRTAVRSRSPNIAVGTNPLGVSTSVDGAFTYVVSNFDGTVTVIDNATNTEKLPRIKVGATPYALGSFVAAFGTTVPTVTSTKPANAATDVSISTTIQATFSDIMDATTINSSTFFVSGGVTGTVTYDSTTKTAQFKPLNDLVKKHHVHGHPDDRHTECAGERPCFQLYLEFHDIGEERRTPVLSRRRFTAPTMICMFGLLRTFRDRYLLPNAWGAAIVAAYYQLFTADCRLYQRTRFPEDADTVASGAGGIFYPVSRFISG